MPAGVIGSRESQLAEQDRDSSRSEAKSAAPQARKQEGAKVSSDARLVFDLQQSAGNKAVSRMLAGPGGATTPVQRDEFVDAVKTLDAEADFHKLAESVVTLARGGEVAGAAPKGGGTTGAAAAAGAAPPKTAEQLVDEEDAKNLKDVTLSKDKMTIRLNRAQANPRGEEHINVINTARARVDAIQTKEDVTSAQKKVDEAVKYKTAKEQAASAEELVKDEDAKNQQDVTLSKQKMTIQLNRAQANPRDQEHINVIDTARARVDAIQTKEDATNAQKKVDEAVKYKTAEEQTATAFEDAVAEDKKSAIKGEVDQKKLLGQIFSFSTKDVKHGGPVDNDQKRRIKDLYEQASRDTEGVQYKKWDKWLKEEKEYVTRDIYM